jgi:flavin-binding protein dodecin
MAQEAFPALRKNPLVFLKERKSPPTKAKTSYSAGGIDLAALILLETQTVNHIPEGKEDSMPEKTYKLIELVGVSENTMEEAIRNALERASQTLKGIDWFEVTEVRGLVQGGKVSQFQVKMKVGFRIMSEREMTGA